MKRSKLLTIPRAATRMLLATLLLTMTAQTAWATIGGTGTQSDPYTINSVDDWNTFASNVNNGTESYSGKTVKLTADIGTAQDPITATVGTVSGSTQGNAFAGIFDGSGHTIHVNITNTSDQGTALFRYISGATIKNVKVTGTVNGTMHCAGLVGFAASSTTCAIKNCEVATSVTCGGNNHSHCGGILGHGLSSTTTISNCLFSGSISGTTSATGIIYGWGDDGTHSIVNCLSAGNYSGCSGVELLKKDKGTESITNCYRKTNGGSQGTDASSMTANELAVALNNGGEEWQVVGDYVVPIMVQNPYNILYATITDVNSRYLYTGSAISITPTVTAADGTVLTENTHYTVTIKNSSNETVPNVINEGDYTLTVTAKDGSSYIGSQIFSFSVSDCPEGLSIDTEYSKGQDGYYYVNMPKTGTTTVTLPDGFTSSFKVYDDGGKNGNYSGGCDGYLILTAPQGFSLKLTGTSTTEEYKSDYLAVYDGNTASDENKRAVIQGKDSNSEDIGTINSSGRSLTLYFSSDNDTYYAGLDLTVELVDSRAPNTITINQSTGGTVTSSAATAYMEDEITLTISPSEGYLLSGLAVKNGEDQNLVTNGGEWYSGSNTSTFVMAGSAVTVTPTFTNNLTAEGGLSMEMPKAGSLTPAIPSGVSSFKVTYDALITEAGTSTLLVTAPEGYLVQLTGHANFTPYCQGNRAIFKVYDGNTTGGQTLSEIQKVNTQFYNDDIYPTVSTGQSMLITCESQYNPITTTTNNYRWYLDLIVTFVKTESHSISSNSVNGTVTSDKQTAQSGETVSLTVTPAEGYVLKDITAADADGAITINKPSADGHWGDEVYYTATSGYSFKMRAKDVTVTPEFIPITDFHVIIPSTSSRTFDIPAETASFKVRHTTFNEHTGQHLSGESETHYSSGYNGTLLLTAPEGYKLHLTGTITTNDDGDYLNVYDGSTIEAIVQRFDGNGYHNAVAVDITSTGNQMLLNFITNGEGSAKGLDLRVTVKPVAYSISFNANATKGVSGTMDPQDFTYNEGAKALTQNAYTRMGYTFAGWNTKADGTGTDYADQADISNLTTKDGTVIELFAKWNLVTYTLTYNGLEGATFSTDKNSYTIESEAITLDAPTKDGYTFAGWFDNAEFTGSAVTTITAGSTGDKTLWAKWIQDLTYGGVTIKDNGTTKSASLDASQEGTISITSDVVVNAVELNRDFTANQPATVMLPFSLADGQTVSGGSFYKFSGVTKDGDVWKAQFTEAATLKANTPYLFNPSADGNMTFDLNNGTVTLNTTTTGESGNTTTNWEFHGTYQKVMWNGNTGGNTDPSDIDKTYGFAKGNATIAAGQFVHFAAGAWLKPMRCYLVYNGSTEGGTFQNAPSRTRGAASTEELPQTITVVLLSSNGETTAIGTLDTKTGDITLDGWYTMDGRKLEGKPTKKGLYINNGRKIVIK